MQAIGLAFWHWVDRGTGRPQFGQPGLSLARTHVVRKAAEHDINAGDLHSIVVGVIAMQRGRAAGLPAGPGLAVVTDGLRANPYA